LLLLCLIKDILCYFRVMLYNFIYNLIYNFLYNVNIEENKESITLIHFSVFIHLQLRRKHCYISKLNFYILIFSKTTGLNGTKLC